MLINDLQFSEHPRDDMDMIMGLLPTYPDLVLSNCLYLYSHMDTDHMMCLSSHVIAHAEKNREFLGSEVFSRMTNLHSTMVVCVLQSLGGVPDKFVKNPLQDLSIGAARELVEMEIRKAGKGMDVSLEEGAEECFVVPSKQLGLVLRHLSFSCTYLRLMVACWIECWRSKTDCSHLAR